MADLAGIATRDLAHATGIRSSGKRTELIFFFLGGQPHEAARPAIKPQKGVSILVSTQKPGTHPHLGWPLSLSRKVYVMFSVLYVNQCLRLIHSLHANLYGHYVLEVIFSAIIENCFFLRLQPLRYRLHNVKIRHMARITHSSSGSNLLVGVCRPPLHCPSRWHRLSRVYRHYAIHSLW